MEKCVKRGELRKVQKRKRQKRRQKAQEKRRQKQGKNRGDMKGFLNKIYHSKKFWKEILQKKIVQISTFLGESLSGFEPTWLNLPFRTLNILSVRSGKLRSAGSIPDHF